MMMGVNNKAAFEERKEPTGNEAKQSFLYRSMKFQSYVFSYMRAQSTSWPYFAYTGFNNYILLINAFNRKFIQRIQLADESQNITICDTYITDTYDLFVLTLNSGAYRLYRIDLDATNAGERDFEDIDFLRSSYGVGEPIFQYTHEAVEGRVFLQLHVRGSSRKEVLDRNEK